MRAPVGLRRLFRVSDCITYRPEKIFEGPRFRRVSRSEYREDRQPDCDRVPLSFHPTASCHAVAMRVWKLTKPLEWLRF